MYKFEITRQTLNTGSLSLIEVYLKGGETDLNPVIDESEAIASFDSETEAWRALEAYKSVIRPDCKKYRPRAAEEALKSVIDEGRGDHRLEEYVLERVAYDEDGEAEEYEFLGRAEFDSLTIYQLQCLSCAAPKNKADWRNGMVTDADPAHVVKNFEALDWHLSKKEALENLKIYNSYVDNYNDAHEYCVEEYIVGDLDDNGTWEWGDIYLSDYPYIKIYIEDNRHTDYLFEDYFSDMEEADNYIDDDWIEEHLHDDDIAIHYLNMDGAEVKTISIDSLREKEDK